MSTELITAIIDRDTPVVVKYLDFVDVNKKDVHERLPLNIAEATGDINLVRLLLNKKAKHKIKDRNGISALHGAINSGSVDMVRFLLDIGVDMEMATKEKETPLHWAARSDSVNIVELLLYYGANVNAENRSRQTPLYIAAERGCVEVMGILLLYGADVNDHPEEKTPIHAAITNKQERAVEYLLNNGVDVKSLPYIVLTAIGFANESIIEMVLSHGGTPNVKTQTTTPLHDAVRLNKPEIIQLLSQHGADMNIATEESGPVLTFAVSRDNLDCVKVLLDCGSDINKADNNGFIVLRYAVMKDNKPMIALLLENGARVDKEIGVRRHESILLHTATEYNLQRNVKELLQKGVCVNIPDEENYTALHHAVRLSYTSMVLMLLGYSADVYADSGDSLPISLSTDHVITQILVIHMLLSRV